jgi:PAS domain S-box-containing protein
MAINASFDSASRRPLFFSIAGWFIVLIALSVMIGWMLNIPVLTQVFPHVAAMKFNTALCFLLSGSAFLLLFYCHRVTSRAFCYGFCLALIGFAMLSASQDVFGWSAGIDQLFAVDHSNFPFLKPGRITPMADACFIFLGISFLWINSPKIGYRKAAQYLLHSVTLLSLIIVMEFLFKAQSTAKFNMLTMMAVSTTLCFLLLSASASAINYDLGFTSIFSGSEIGNIVARKLFPRMVFILVLLGYIRIEMERRNYISEEFGVIISTLSFLLISLFLIRDTLTDMNRLDLQRSKAENEIRTLNRTLEDTVTRRTLDLKESNDRIIKIINASPAGICMSNLATGFYMDVNPSLLAMLGYERDEMIGHSSSELNIIDDDKMKSITARLNENGTFRNEDVVLRRKDGSEVQCKLSVELVDYKNQKFAMSFIYDVSDLKKVEKNLQDAKKDLEILTDKLTYQNKRLLEFAQITSHNLRSPVSNLNLLIHFYKESETPEDRHDLWTNFETVVQHVNQTLDELLETLKIQEDTAKQREELRFQDVLDKVKAMLVGQIKESAAIFITDFSKAPGILYPRSYLESIMLNLLSNAIKYRSPGRRLQIKLVSDNVDGIISLRVEDNGSGIDMARHKQNLFGLRKTFHRHAEARGLGLFITKTQIEAMGGEIAAESKVDKGTVFKIIFNKHF